MFGLAFWFGLVLTALLLAVGHWAPWPRRLHRLAAYTYGVAAILTGAGLWLVLVDRWLIWLGLLAFAVAGGAATAGCWALDWALNARLRQRQPEPRQGSGDERDDD